MTDSNRSINYLKNARQELIFSFLEFDDLTFWGRLKTPNFYAIFLSFEGQTTAHFDGRKLLITENNLLFYYPYQELSFDTTTPLKGFFIQFHPDFFCLDIQGKEVGCQGILFNNAFYGALLNCSAAEIDHLKIFFYTFFEEMEKKEAAHLELIINTLRILLINCVRIKIKQGEGEFQIIPDSIKQLESLLTLHLLKHHDIPFYAQQLQLSTSTLNRLCQTHFKKSLSKIIEDKIVALAKKKLFLTNQSVKEIAHELGFDDPFYFSRFFKKSTQLSPVSFRKKLQNERLEALSIQ